MWGQTQNEQLSAATPRTTANHPGRFHHRYPNHKVNSIEASGKSSRGPAQGCVLRALRIHRRGVDAVAGRFASARAFDASRLGVGYAVWTEVCARRAAYLSGRAHPATPNSLVSGNGRVPSRRWWNWKVA